MKTAAFAIALLMSGAAIAGGSGTTKASQDPAAQGTTDQNLGTTMAGEQPAPSSTAIVPEDGPASSSMTTQTDPATSAPAEPSMAQTGDTTPASSPDANFSMASAGDPIAEPSNAAPERDAHGVKVISAAARVPDGFNGVAGTAAGGPLVDPATGAELSDEASYPACSRKVTDNCVQKYERGRKS